MKNSTHSSEKAQFDDFEFDLRTADLRKHGDMIRLQEKPFQILSLLLEKAGEIVTRDELKQRLWPLETVIHFEENLNTSLNRLRQALGDSASKQRLIRTIPRQGYRFIAPITWIEEGAAGDAARHDPVETTATNESTTNTQSQVPPAHHAKSRAVLATAFVAILILVYMMFHRGGAVPLQNFTITQITNSGNATRAGISPDGKFVLSVVDEGEKQGLWLRNIPTGSVTQVLASEGTLILAPTFSPDANFIYYRRSTDPMGTVANLYRIPVLGGTPQLLARDVDVGAEFSPDAKRMAYIRANDPDLGKYRLLTANPDGSDEKVLRVAPTPTPVQFSWSPDAARIAYVVGRKEMRGAVRTYEIASGDDRPVKSFDDKIATDIAWMPDGRGMLINYSDERAGFTRPQLGYVSYPGGEFHAITNDTHGYFGMQLSADAKSVVAIQRERSESVVMLPSTGMGTPAPVGWIPNQAEINGLNWDGKGNLIVALRTSIVRIAVGGTQMMTIMSDPNAAINDATFCSPDGPILVSWLYREGHAAQNIWRLDADGTHPKQLTSGKEDRLPLCSPDRKWVYYFDFDALNIKRVPFDGGTAETVPGSVVKDGFIHKTGVNFSPDGKWLVSVATTVDPKTQVPSHPVALVDVESKNQSSTRLLTGHENVSFPAGFTPDGKAVVYRIIENGAENIWMQPLDGSSGHQLTHFTNDHIKFFEWSPDGRTLAVIRVHTEANVVLLRDAGAAGR